MEFIPAKTIISGYSDGGNWFGCNYNMNIYKGCSHGCIYCDSRSECYRVENFDEVRAKADALNIIAAELKSKRKSGVIGSGAMSDPYNPREREHRLTRGALELIARSGRFGVALATKSDLIVRDFDLLAEINRQQPVITKITVTCADDKLCAEIEPNAARPMARFSALEALAGGGIFCGVLLMPVLPFIEDNPENIRAIVRQAQGCGAKFIYPAFGVTLRQNQREWYYRKLDEHFPGLKAKYVKQFGNSYSCSSPVAGELWQVFREECADCGILYRMCDIIAAYKCGKQPEQLQLF